MTTAEMIELLPEEHRDEARQTLERFTALEDIRTADQAIEAIKGNESLKRGYDKIAQQAVETYKRRFEDEQLPEMRKTLREEVMRELQPEETPEQKRLRALEEELRQRDEKERLYQTRDKLRAKAKELGFDEELAERFAVMPEPETELTTFAERMQQAIEKAAEKQVSERWGNRTPRTSAGGGGKITSIDQVPPEWTPADYARAVEAGQIDF